MRGRLWSFAPSLYVALATVGNAVIATIMAYVGALAAPVPGVVLFGLLVVVLAATLLLDEFKLVFFKRTRISNPVGDAVAS